MTRMDGRKDMRRTAKNSLRERSGSSRQHQSEAQPGERGPGGRGHVLWLSFGIGGTILLLAVLALLLLAQPKLSVSPSSEVTSDDIGNTVFVLSNQGRFPVYDATLACSQNNTGELIDGVAIDLGHTSSSVLPPNNSVTLTCPDAIQDQARTNEEASVVLLLAYRPAWFPWHRHSAIGMKAHVLSSGNWTWSERPNELELGR